MVDAKRYKEVSSGGTVASVGSFGSSLADGSTTLLKASGSGVLYTALVNSTGTVELSLVQDNAAGAAAPTLATVGGLFRSTLPTYADGDGAIIHLDSRGRLCMTQINASTGTTADVSTDDAAGPANPTGTWPMAKFTSSAPTLTSGDASVLHVSSAGRLHVEEQRPSTSSTSNVTAATSNTTVAASNANRLALFVYNDSSAIMYLKLGATASTTSYTVQVPASTLYELPQPAYTGIIDAVWASATGNARVTELTA